MLSTPRPRRRKKTTKNKRKGELTTTGFKQQDLTCGGRCWIWRPLHTPKSAGIFCACLGMIFILIGIPFIVENNSIVVLTMRYDDTCDSGTVCYANITVSEEMKAPVYVYYQVTGVYQNHRAYASSQNEDQLEGEQVSEKDLEASCDPANDYQGKKIFPCGLKASSVFNDSIALRVCQAGAGVCEWMSGDNWKAQAWPSDEEKYKARDITQEETRSSYFSGKNGSSYEIPNLDDKRLINWMRPARGPSFTKLERILHTRDLKRGEELNFVVEDNWESSRFSGQKSLVISTMSGVGGKNDFFGYCYVVVGALMVTLALVLVITNMKLSREPGEMMYFAINEIRPLQ
mmetsp:Transcript_3498/g.6696  ORF Transcript_3498/g.6696 Transcript_3498/m.6696 type:complete len:345 (-) Transcript_3498:214-1248(-)